MDLTEKNRGDYLCFMQTGNTVQINPLPGEGVNLNLHYYAQREALETNDDLNEWSTIYPYALIYGAAIFAAHHYEDERLQPFTDQYGVFLQEIEDRSLREDFSGPMRVQPAYDYQQHGDGWSM